MTKSVKIVQKTSKTASKILEKTSCQVGAKILAKIATNTSCQDCYQDVLPRLFLRFVQDSYIILSRFLQDFARCLQDSSKIGKLLSPDSK